VRFFLEMLRGDYAEPWLLGLKSAQATSLGIFLILLALFMYCGWREKQQVQPAANAKNAKKGKK
ncbi:MAG: prolipoprotein diacylglyceryl transferase, partial [Phascolarctobacterium sp.]